MRPMLTGSYDYRNKPTTVTTNYYIQGKKDRRICSTGLLYAESDLAIKCQVGPHIWPAHRKPPGVLAYISPPSASERCKPRKLYFTLFLPQSVHITLDYTTLPYQWLVKFRPDSKFSSVYFQDKIWVCSLWSAGQMVPGLVDNRALVKKTSEFQLHVSFHTSLLKILLKNWDWC